MAWEDDVALVTAKLTEQRGIETSVAFVQAMLDRPPPHGFLGHAFAVF